MLRAVIFLGLLSSLTAFANTQNWNCNGPWVGELPNGGINPSIPVKAEVQTSSKMGDTLPMKVTFQDTSYQGTETVANPYTFEIVVSEDITITGTLDLGFDVDPTTMTVLLRGNTAQGSHIISILNCTPTR